MKIGFLAVAVAAVFAAGCATSGSGASGGVRGDHVEACECDTYCPCVFSKDATAGECRGIMAWHATEGSFEGTSLAGVTWAASLTKSGKNVEKSLGKLEGVLFLPEKATEAQRKAIGDMMKKDMGAAFAKMDVKVTSIELKGELGHNELTVGKMITVKISPLKGVNGKVPVLENCPSPLTAATPKIYCGKADVHLYDDGSSKWDFAGHNAYYSMFQMGGEK